MEILATAIVILAAALVFTSLYLGGKMVTNTQALAELTQMDADLGMAITNATAALSQLLTDIKNNNGVNPGAVDGLVNKGEGLIKNLNDAVSSALNTANPPAIAVAISPASATLAVGATQQFSATVSNDSANAGVTWSLAPVAAGSPTGTVDQTGLYTAPATAGSDTVVATSVTDTTKSGSASVTFA